MEVTYYFTGYDVANAWETTPEKAVDNNLGTYASTLTDGDNELVNTNNCPGTDLGTITKVELRVYAYGDVDDRIDLHPWAAEYQTTPGVNPDWTTYVDITHDVNAPDPWTWADVVALDCWLEFDKVGKGNTMYCAKVEIRVTYTPVVAVPRHGFVNFQVPGIV